MTEFVLESKKYLRMNTVQGFRADDGVYHPPTPRCHRSIDRQQYDPDTKDRERRCDFDAMRGGTRSDPSDPPDDGEWALTYGAERNR